MAEQRTRRAIQKCGEWLALCLRLGWSRERLDALEALWWEHHDERGNLNANATPVAASVAAPTTPSFTIPRDTLEAAAVALEEKAWQDGLMVDPQADEDACVIRAALAAPQPNTQQPIPESVYPTARSECGTTGAPSVALPARVIDVLMQQSGVSTYHPDGDQLEVLHKFAHAVKDEVLARLPSGAAAGATQQNENESRPESEPASCREDDGCPTEGAVLRREWRSQRALLEQALAAIESAEQYGAGSWPTLVAAIRAHLQGEQG